MLSAIAIYDLDSTKKPLFKRLACAQQEKGLFASNQFEDLEKITLPTACLKSSEEKQNSVTLATVNGEHHYLKQIGGSSKMMTIVTRRKLIAHELTYLFKNIEHIYLRPTKVGNHSLEQIIANPLRYTGKDILLSSTSEKAEEVKIQVSLAIAKQLENGVKLQELDDLSLQLEKEAKIFEHDARKLNSCCRL